MGSANYPPVFPVVVVNPRRVRSFGHGMGILAKTDAIDARLAGKPPKLAFVAVARKLLTILNAIARERTAWHA